MDVDTVSSHFLNSHLYLYISAALRLHPRLFDLRAETKCLSHNWDTNINPQPQGSALSLKRDGEETKERLLDTTATAFVSSQQLQLLSQDLYKTKLINIPTWRWLMN